jgi:hypothetical protein
LVVGHPKLHRERERERERKRKKAALGQPIHWSSSLFRLLSPPPANCLFFLPVFQLPLQRQKNKNPHIKLDLLLLLLLLPRSQNPVSYLLYTLNESKHNGLA